MANFTADKKAARTESFSAGSIKTTGLFTGHFTKAYLRESKSSAALAIHLDFISTCGHSGQIDIWFKNGQGDDIERSVNQIQGLMALLDIEELREKKNDLVEMYDWDLRAVKQVRMTTYPQLIEKHIGTVWQIEEYLKQVKGADGKYYDAVPADIKERAVFVRFCDAETHQTPGEYIDNAEAKTIDDFILKMPDIKRVKASAAKVEEARDTASFKKADNYVEDDDIPF